jgi:hypothetical protein
VPRTVVPAPRPELGRDLDHEVGREAAAPGVLAHGLGVLGLVQAVDLVARHEAVVPRVLGVEAVHDLVGGARDLPQLLGGELRCAGDVALDQEGSHDS